MSFKNIKFSDPVESLSGKRNKKSNTCFYQGQTYGQRAWGLGSRNTVLHPVTGDEQAIRRLMGDTCKQVSGMLKPTHPQYMQTLMAYNTAKNAGETKSLRQWLFNREYNKLASERQIVFKNGRETDEIQ